MLSKTTSPKRNAADDWRKANTFSERMQTKMLSEIKTRDYPKLRCDYVLNSGLRFLQDYVKMLVFLLSMHAPLKSHFDFMDVYLRTCSRSTIIYAMPHFITSLGMSKVGWS